MQDPRLYHGWLVVAAAFLIALFGFGLGFYGPGIYLVALSGERGWPVAALSPVVTAYYVLGAVLLFGWIGRWFEWQGPRIPVATGVVALAAGLALLGLARQRWQVYAAFAPMALGWATMSGAAINIIVAPWFERRRGIAVSWALNGASAGGIVMPPLLTWLISRFGFAAGLDFCAAAMLLVLLPLAGLVLRGRRSEERDAADAGAPLRPAGPLPVLPWSLTATLRSGGFLTISLPFALGLTAQVGFLTHQVAFLRPTLGNIAAAWAVSLTTASAIFGRLLAGSIADRVNRRLVAGGNFIVQATGMAILASAAAPGWLCLGCALFGLGLGNTTSLPGLIVQDEFPRQHFARIVSLVVAINQFTFAFGPGILGRLQGAEGNYRLALLL
jgi:MFS family permease